MWGTVMAVNSFFVWPLSLMFLVYALGRMLLFFDWKLFVIAVIVFAVSTGAQMVIGILAD
jgi:hypothetical protein